MFKIGIIESLDKSLWYDTKKVLEHKINQVKGFEKVKIGRYNNWIDVSGEITFKFTDDCAIVLWNICSKCSGREVALSDLNKVQGLVKEWWTEEIGGSND